MKKLTNILLIFSVALFTLNSCGFYYYTPSKHNVLQFKEQGDATFSAGFSGSGIGGSAGYAFSPSIGYITSFNAFFGNESSTLNSSKDVHYLDNYFWDNEIVYYKNLKYNFKTSVNFGFGYGELAKNIKDFELKANRTSILPSFGYSNKVFDFAVSTRFSKVTYDFTDYKTSTMNNWDGDYYSCNEMRDYYGLGEIGRKDYFFIEPAITIGVGYKFIKFRAQYMYSENMNSDNMNNNKCDLSLSVNLKFNIK